MRACMRARARHASAHGGVRIGGLVGWAVGEAEGTEAAGGPDGPEGRSAVEVARGSVCGGVDDVSGEL